MAGEDGRAGLRPSRREREPYLTAINVAMAEGRIDADEHATRVELAESATSFADLDALVSDIPFVWHDEEQEAARRSARRRFILGSAGLLALGGLSWFGTRSWIGASDTAAAGPPSARPSASATPSPSASSAALPTSMVQVVNWQRETMPTAIGYAEEQGVKWVSDISAWGDYFILSGVTQDRRARTISFHTDRRPEIEDGDGELEGYPAADLRDLDMEKLLTQARQAAELGALEGIRLSIRHWPDLWTIGIGGDDDTVYWRIDGTTRWDPETEW